MNRTIKDATVKQFHYERHDQLRTHLADFLAAYNFARKLKTLNDLTPYEYICKIRTSEPERYILDPIHQMPGLNTRQQGRRQQLNQTPDLTLPGQRAPAAASYLESAVAGARNPSQTAEQGSLNW